MVSKSFLEGLSASNKGDHPCSFCPSKFPSSHDLIRHHQDRHCIISGLVCPYCDGCKKFDDVDAHVKKHHHWDQQSPIQDCKVCKVRLVTYEELRGHRQIHDKKTVEVSVGGRGDSSSAATNATGAAGEGGGGCVTVHSRVGAMADIGNRGGVKCLLCNTFKLRKDHLRDHYVRHHGWVPGNIP